MSLAASDVLPEARLVPTAFIAFSRLASVNTGYCFCGAAATCIMRKHTNAKKTTTGMIESVPPQESCRDNRLQIGERIELARAVTQLFDRHAQPLQDCDVQIGQRL